MLTDDDIHCLTRSTPLRDWLNSNDPRPFEEYKQWWETIYGEFN